MKKIVFLFVVMVATQLSIAQVDGEWERQTHITGYVNAIAEYTDLQNWKEAEKNVGIGISEAGFLVSYKPLEKLEFKGTFIYTHYILDIQSIFVEAYATYSFSDKFKLSAGKYLTPLSPVNQYFYAPLNPSATLPMVVSHHALLPQSISGFQISGEFGNNFKAGYNITYGNYMTESHPSLGILGLQGREDYAAYLVDDVKRAPVYLLGGSARLYANYGDIFTFGLNYFEGTNGVVFVQEVDLSTGDVHSFDTRAKRFSVGADLELKVSDFKLNSEIWYGESRTTDIPIEDLSTYDAFYVELIYEKGIFSPYFRYDYVNDIKATTYAPFPDTPLFKAEAPTTAYTIGLAIRPIYEILVKVEYRHIKNDFKDNPLNVQYDNYNHLALSLVYSF